MLFWKEGNSFSDIVSDEGIVSTEDWNHEELTTSRNKQEMRDFLGLCTYYLYIALLLYHFSRPATAPLRKLTDDYNSVSINFRS